MLFQEFDMKRNTALGVADPVTLAFLLSLLGVATALSLDTIDSSATVDPQARPVVEVVDDAGGRD
jgi:hypothetical protein